MRVLLIEDEHKLANAIKRALELQKYAVDIAYGGDGGLSLAIGGETYDLIVSDIMLPGIDGIELCKKIRQEGIHTPILMLTAKGQTQDKVSGLDGGADDYMVKPFSFDELFARVRALVRRPNDDRDPTLRIADLSLDPAHFKATRAGTQIRLSTKEFSLLEYLMRNQNKVLRKEQLISHVWDYNANVLPGTVEVHIKNLRDKIDKPYANKLIHTIRGFGYEMKEEN